MNNWATPYNAERIAAMLNGAYNLGYSAAKLEQELENGNTAT